MDETKFRGFSFTTKLTTDEVCGRIDRTYSPTLDDLFTQNITKPPAFLSNKVPSASTSLVNQSQGPILPVWLALVIVLTFGVGPAVPFVLLQSYCYKRWVKYRMASNTNRERSLERTDLDSLEDTTESTNDTAPRPLPVRGSYSPGPGPIQPPPSEQHLPARTVCPTCRGSQPDQLERGLLRMAADVHPVYGSVSRMEGSQSGQRSRSESPPPRYTPRASDKPLIQ